MTVSDEMEAEIRRLFFAEHWKRGTIATQLGLHPDVVARVTGPLGPAPGTPRASTAVLGPIGRARPHPRLAQQTVGEVLEQEKPRLLSLPTKMPPLEILTPVKVDSQAFVHLDTNRYSVPTPYAPGTLTMAATDTTVRFLKQWGSVFRDATCLSALIDRFAQHCHTIDIEADSWRQKTSVRRTRPGNNPPRRT